MGDLPAGMGLTRKRRSAGDDIWVSGTVGDAYAALMCRWGRWQVMPDAEPRLFARMDRPTPRIALGQALLGAATACADISDGLLADLDHILTRSGVSAEIEWERIPLSPVLSTLTIARQHEAALAGGDDYELIFTAPPAAAERIFEAGLALQYARFPHRPYFRKRRNGCCGAHGRRPACCSAEHWLRSFQRGRSRIMESVWRLQCSRAKIHSP